MIDVAVDDAGFIYVLGTTTPHIATRGAAQESPAGSAPFIAKLTPDGADLVYLTYYGATRPELVRVLPAGDGDVFIVGHSGLVPDVNAIQARPNGSGDLVVARLNEDGSQFEFSTYLGGSNMDFAADAKVDVAGNLLIVGHTMSPDFPLLNAMDPTFSPGKNRSADVTQGFLLRLSADGQRIISSTFIGGSSNTRVDTIDLDDAGGIHLGGTARPQGFPLIRPVDSDLPARGLYRYFAMKLDPEAQQIVHSTFYGRPFDSQLPPNALAAAPDGSTYLVVPSPPGQMQIVAPLAGTERVETGDFIWRIAPEGGRLLLASRLPASPGVPGARFTASLVTDAAGRPMVQGVFRKTTGPDDFLWGSATFSRFISIELFQRIDPTSGRIDRALSMRNGLRSSRPRFALSNDGNHLLLGAEDHGPKLHQTTPNAYRNAGEGSAVIAVDLSHPCMPRPGMVGFHLNSDAPVGAGEIRVPCLHEREIVVDKDATWLSAVPNEEDDTLRVAVDGSSLADGIYRSQVRLRDKETGHDLSIPISAEMRRRAWLPVTELRLRGFAGLDGGRAYGYLTIEPPERREVEVETSGAGWLRAHAGDRSVRVEADPSELEPGEHVAVVRVTPAGGPAAEVRVFFEVVPLPELQFSEQLVEVRYRRGDPPPKPVVIRVESGTASSSVSVTPGASSCRGAGRRNQWLTVWPSSIMAGSEFEILVQPRGLPAGVYEGSVGVSIRQLLPPRPLTHPHFPGMALPVWLIVEDGDGPRPEIPWDHVVNAASYEWRGIAPGQLSVVFAPGIGSQTLRTLEVGPNGRVTTQLGDVRVLVNSKPTPLLYSAPDQVAFVAPFSLQGFPCAYVQVEQNGYLSHPAVLEVLDTTAFFSLDSSGQGQAAALNEDGSINGPENPAPRGSVVSLFFTGLSQRFGPDELDGAIGTTRASSEAFVFPPYLKFTFTTGGPSAQSEALYVGQAPTLVAGVGQVNVRIPLDAPTGDAIAVKGLNATHEAKIAIR